MANEVLGEREGVEDARKAALPARFSQRGWASTWTLVDGLRVHARVAGREGRRPPVVLVHGLLVSSRYMAALARVLGETVRVWAPDMPGFGRSDNPPKTLDVAGLARWLGRWMEVRALSGVVMVANSFGCQYAARLVAEAPSRVKALVLLGPTMDRAHRTAIGQAARWLANAPLEPPSLALVVARDLLDCGLRRVLITYSHGLAHAIEDDLRRIPVETMVARGERDPLVTQRWTEDCAAMLPRGRLVVVEGAAHTLNYNSPESACRIIDGLL